EKEDDQHREQRALDQGAPDVLHRYPDRARAVRDRLQPHAGRQLRLHLLDGLFQAVGHLDRVLVLRLLHRQEQGSRAVVKRQAVQLLSAVGDAGDLVDAHRRSVPAGDDDLAEVLRALHASVDLHDTVLRQRADGAHWQVLVFGTHGVRHLVGRDAHGFHRGRVQVDVDLAPGATHERDRADAAHVLQPLAEHLVGPVGELDRAHFLALGGVGQDGQRPDGAAAGSKRRTRGSFTSVRKFGRMNATFSRTSSAALRPSMCSWNSMMTTAMPSWLREVRVLMPAIELTPSSIFLVTSLSTISGEAPGYSAVTTTTGKSMLGNWSTCSR